MDKPGAADTDDHLVNRPTDGWADTMLTPGTLAGRLQQHEARIAAASSRPAASAPTASSWPS
jgi:hypothetical protein